MKSSSIIRLIRPGQWIKNLFVFLPLFFSGNILCIEKSLHCAVIFVALCFASSAIYCLNDLCDADYDISHPVKRLRPIAAGEIGKPIAVTFSVGLSVFALIIPFLFLPRTESFPSAIIISLYLLLNVVYCFGLKNISILDVIIISFGFVLRVGAGGTSTGIIPSHWILIMTFLLALFLALSKRREDILIFSKTEKHTRNNVEKYSISFINQAITMVGTVMLVSYIMYTVSSDVIEQFNSNFVYTTSLFVLLGLLRYMQLTIVFSKTGSPTYVLLHDRFIQICIACWIIQFVIIIYL